MRAMRRIVVALSSVRHTPVQHADALIEGARSTIGVCLAADAYRAGVRRLLARWDAIDRQIAEIDDSLEAIVSADPRCAALVTIPSVSVVTTAVLIGEIGDINNYESPRQVLKMAGLGLSRRQSGTTILGPVRITKRGRPALRRELFILAGRWCRSDGILRARYDAIVARNGSRRIKAITALSRSLVPLIFHILKTGEPFDLARWQRDHASRGLGPA